MKKLYLSLLGLALTSSAFAGTYTVYNNGTLGSNLHYYEWWEAKVNDQAVDPLGGSDKVLSFQSSTGGAGASYGYELQAPGNTGPLYCATLTFDWYAEGTGSYVIRLTGGGAEYNYTLPAATGEGWQTASIDIATEFDKLSTAWKDNASNGKGYVFSTVLSDGSSDAVIYFKNIQYIGTDDSWTEPAPPTPDVTYPDGTVFAVWPNSTESDVVNINPAFYFWGGGYNTEMTEDNVTFQRFTSTGDTWFGGGYLTPSTFNMSTITGGNYDLVFDVRLSSAEIDFRIKITDEANGSAAEKSFLVDKINEWVPMRINLQNNFGDQMAAYKFGDEMYIFSPVANKVGGGALTSGCYIDFANVRIEPYQKPDAVPAGTTWYGTLENTEGFACTIDYKVVVNEDQSLTYYANVSNTADMPGFNVVEININDAWNTMVATDAPDYAWTFKGTDTYLKGDQVKCFFYIPYTGGAVRQDFTYSFGASNEPPVALPVIIASAENVTENSADIVYSVSLPEALTGATVEVTVNGEAATASPFSVSGLTSNTEYTYTIAAKATLNGEIFEAKSVDVTFRTLRAAGEEDPVVTGQSSGNISNCWLVGTSNKDLISFDVTFAYSITYNADETLTIEFTPDNEKFQQVVGMVPQMFINNAYVGNFSESPARAVSYTFTTPNAYKAGDTLTLNFYGAFDGGNYSFTPFEYVVGSKDQLTGVEEISVENAPVRYFNLNGVEVANPDHGIFIRVQGNKATKVVK